MGPGGYAWWYVDGVSADGARAITVIGFIGSVFSPYYRWSGRRAPLEHSAINVGLYDRGTRWAMTERGAGAVARAPERFAVGPSAIGWDGTALTVEIDEVAVPHLRRIRGRVTVRPAAITDVEVALGDGHVWRPFAPVAEIEVDLGRADWRWRGHGYLDANFGDRPLEADFRSWTWGRYPRPEGAAVVYDARRRDGSALEVALAFDREGAVRPFAPPPLTRMAASRWLLPRETRADPGSRPVQVKAMLDVPFYCRSLVRTRIEGRDTVGVHEALDLDRFANPLVQMLLPFRMPRRARWPQPGKG